jgi:hypothetical protein
MFECLTKQYKLWRLYKKKLIQKLYERNKEVSISENSMNMSSSEDNIIKFDQEIKP